VSTLRHRPRSVALLRLGYRVAYRCINAYAFVRRPRVRGVMCVVSDGGGRVLLVRHTYGDRLAWELPGGWVGRSEEPVDAARREAFEELGVAIDGWEPLGVVEGLWHFKRERLTFFAGRWPGGTATVDPVEIAEARWFDPAEPPERLGEGTQAVFRTFQRGQTPMERRDEGV
jgi:8-oxo-dGTP pyrophosphatase MutT (NUDIX family)